MLQQKGRLPESPSKWILKPPTNVFCLPKFDSPPRSPKCVFSSFKDVIHSENKTNDGLYCSLVPKGYLAVYVGKEAMRRFVIPLNYLSHSIFKALLKKAEEEFGFSSNGVIRLPCESLLFEHFLWLLKNNDPMAHHLEMEELLSFYDHEHREINS